MTWTAPPTFTAGQILTSAQLNTLLRDNMLETAPAKSTSAGQFFVSTGTNSIVGRLPVQDPEDAIFTTTTNSWSVLTGPSVTTNVTARALISLYSYISNDTASSSSWAGFDVTGAHSLSPQENLALMTANHTSGRTITQSSAVFMLPITAGESTFGMRYKTSAGTATFDHRRIAVLPF